MYSCFQLHLQMPNHSHNESHAYEHLPHDKGIQICLLIRNRAVCCEQSLHLMVSLAGQVEKHLASAFSLSGHTPWLRHYNSAQLAFVKSISRDELKAKS